MDRTTHFSIHYFLELRNAAIRKEIKNRKNRNFLHNLIQSHARRCRQLQLILRAV